jgi:anti-sigma B factor antagonist
MDQFFSVKTHKSGCCEVLRLAGELDIGTASHLEAVLDRMMVIPDHIIVDVAELTYIDSTGLRLLLRASQLVDGRVEIRNASLAVRRLIQLSGLSEHFCTAANQQVAHRIITHRRPLKLVSARENLGGPHVEGY